MQTLLESSITQHIPVVEGASNIKLPLSSNNLKRFKMMELASSPIMKKGDNSFGFEEEEEKILLQGGEMASKCNGADTFEEQQQFVQRDKMHRISEVENEEGDFQYNSQSEEVAGGDSSSISEKGRYDFNKDLNTAQYNEPNMTMRAEDEDTRKITSPFMTKFQLGDPNRSLFVEKKMSNDPKKIPLLSVTKCVTLPQTGPTLLSSIRKGNGNKNAPKNLNNSYLSAASNNSDAFSPMVNKGSPLNGSKRVLQEADNSIFDISNFSAEIITDENTDNVINTKPISNFSQSWRKHLDSLNPDSVSYDKENATPTSYKLKRTDTFIAEIGSIVKYMGDMNTHKKSRFAKEV